jgi:hypothetical protein
MRLDFPVRYLALVRQVLLGAIAQVEKASAIAKLAAALKSKREREGRKPLRENRPEVVALARKLRRRKPKGGQLSLRGIANELAAFALAASVGCFPIFVTEKPRGSRRQFGNKDLGPAPSARGRSWFAET